MKSAAVVHSVPGVEALLLGELRADTDPVGSRLERVIVFPARRQGATTLPAELLILSAGDVDMQEAP